MAEDGFSFLCATFYRWAQLFPALCSKLARAPKVLGVGDLHVENYGTWRDAEGRLVWGINDFDEACPLAYTNDLVRLATSAWLAIEADALALGRGTSCRMILEGYVAGLEGGGRPVVLSEHNRWLRDAVTSRLRDPTKFWQKLAARADGARCSDGGAVVAESSAAGVETGIAHGVSAGGFGQPRAAPLHRSGRVARGKSCARGEGFATVGVVVGRGRSGRQADLFR